MGLSRQRFYDFVALECRRKRSIVEQCESSNLGKVGVSATGDVLEGLSSLPLIPIPGVVWRSCWFRVAARLSLRWCHPEFGDIEVSLPHELRTAVPERQSEFLAGRVCAGYGLRALDFPESVGRAGRVPIWPHGARGSISHSGNIAVAAVARGEVMLGIDYQQDFSEEEAFQVRNLVMTADEFARKPAEICSLEYITLIFSAKEAAYKAMMLERQRIPEFCDASVLKTDADRVFLDFEGKCIVARFRRCFRGFVSAATDINNVS